MTSVRTGTARVSGVYDNKRNARKLSIIRSKVPQLGDSPTEVSCALRPPNRAPLANALEVLQGDAAGCVFGGLDDGPRNAMVLVAPKSRFSACQAIQALLGSLCASP